MPQVPDSFVPSATTSPLGVSPMSAQPVQPMRNAAPEQMQQSGAATQRLGDETNSIGERIQNQLDTAMAKQAMTGFLKDATTINYGDGTPANPGYLNLRGQDALNALPGAQAALAKAKQAGADGLADDFQRSMYNRVASQHLVNFGREMADHNFQQRTLYAIQSASDSAEMSGVQASSAWKSWNSTDPDGNSTGDFNTFSQVRDQSVIEGANQRNGTHDTLATPSDKMAPQTRVALLQARSGTARTALALMITAQAPSADVQGFFDGMKAKGYIDPRDEIAMASAVKSYVVPKNLNDTMNGAFTDAYRANHPVVGTGAQGPDNYQGLVKGAGFTTSPYDEDADGVHVTIPQNSQVTAPGSGTVSAVGKNDDEVPFVSIQHPDGSTSTVTGMNTFNVKAGDAVKMGQQIGTSGNAGGQKNPSVLWQLADKNGAFIDPTHAGLPAVDPQSIVDEKDLTDAVQLFRDRETNTDLQREGAAQMEGIVRQNQHMVLAGREQDFQNAQHQFYGPAIKSGGIPHVSSIDPALYHSLPDEQQYQLRDIETQQGRRALTDAREDQNARLMAETAANMPNQINALFWLNTHPDANMTDLTSVAKYLTPQQTTEWAGKITNHDSQDVKIDQNQLRTSLTQSGLQGLFNLEGQKDTQKLQSQQRFNGVTSDVQKILNDARNAKKAPLSPTETQKLMNDYLINNQVMVHQTSWYRSDDDYSQDQAVNFANLTPDQMAKAYVNTDASGNGVPLSHITPEQRDTITAGLLRAGHAPTMVNIAKAWRAMGGH
jgi:murein DD-endopeptidase MepM/ murein hydrolase activator NlpD